MKKYLLLLTILSLLACWPFLKKGYFESHDGEWMVIRFTAFHQALADGQFPVRFVDRLNNNYGYPVLNFLYPLPFYLAEIPKIVGFGFVDSIKIIFVLSTVASVLAMFWALSQVSGISASLAGAIVYLFIPYRFVDLYVRGSLGENMAFVFVPLIAGCIIKFKKGEKKFLPLLSISVAAFILSHNVVAVLMLPFLSIWAFLQVGKKLWNFILPLIFALLVSAFFWIPALFDLQFVSLSQIKVSEISNHLVNPSKLIIPGWGYGPNPNSPDGLSVQIGLVPFFIMAASIMILLKTKKDFKIVTFLLVAILFIFFANTELADPIWQILPGVDIIQFPWRMHSILIFIAAYLAAYTIENSRKKILLVSLIATASILSTIFYTLPAAFVDKGDGFYATNEDTTNVRDEYLPLWVKVKPDKRPGEKIELVGPGQIVAKSIAQAKYSATIDAQEEIKVQVNTIYFPGWKVKSDGLDTSIDYQNPQGLITFNLPQGIHKVIISYSKSPVHLASEIISLLAILATGVYAYRLWQKSTS